MFPSFRQLSLDKFVQYGRLQRNWVKTALSRSNNHLWPKDKKNTKMQMHIDYRIRLGKEKTLPSIQMNFFFLMDTHEIKNPEYEKNKKLQPHQARSP